MNQDDKTIYGLIAEFRKPEQLVAATRSARASGYTDVQTYTPFPIDELSDLVKIKHRNWVPAIVLIGGIFGGCAGFLMQYYAMAISYPLNVGGRPLFSWPSFIPITFELTVLGAALFGAFGMLALSGLPRPYHPVFTVPEFRLASDSGFFLCIKSTDQLFDPKRTESFLEQLNPVNVTAIRDPGPTKYL